MRPVTKKQVHTLARMIHWLSDRKLLKEGMTPAQVEKVNRVVMQVTIMISDRSIYKLSSTGKTIQNLFDYFSHLLGSSQTR